MAIVSIHSARNAASILRRRYATVIGTPLRRHASLTLQVSASTFRNLAPFCLDQSRADFFFSCGLAAATRVSCFLRATLHLPLILRSRAAASRRTNKKGGRSQERRATRNSSLCLRYTESA